MENYVAISLKKTFFYFYVCHLRQTDTTDTEMMISVVDKNYLIPKLNIST